MLRGDDSMRRLIAAARRLGIELDTTAVERFRQYRELLLEANRRFNLTRVTDPVEMELRLFADSLALLPLIPTSARTLIDVGSGGGIPGIPLAIGRPDLDIVLLDATGKKVRFLAETIVSLGLQHVQAIAGRAEGLGRDARHREQYDVVTARAVARLVTLAELTLPLAKRGGIVLLPKGSAAAEEQSEARYAISMLGGRARPPVVPPLEGTTIIVIDKIRSTPEQYPRRDGVPAKSPLLGPRERPTHE